MAVGIFGKNLRALREDKGMTQQELADALQVTATTVSLWETRDRFPKQADITDAICNVFKCDKQKLFGYTDGYYATRNGLRIEQAKASQSFAPIIGDIAAGSPREALEEVNGMRWVDPDILDEYPSGFFLRIAGDSMDLVLPDGSYAFVAPVEVRTGDIAAVKVNGDDATVKRVKLYDGVVILEPESNNPAHKRRVIDQSDPDAPSVRMIGKVVWFAGDLR